jgi:glutathione synthase/RimK-type ligase-like ATP-grasp enzyme
MQPFVIFHEHPDWFKPLFAELDKRGIPHVAMNPVEHQFAIEEKAPKYALLFNCMSPSAHLRGGMQGTFYTLNYLKHLENQGLRVINGYRAFTYETSKALQLILMQQLGLKYPKTHVVNHISQIEAAVTGLRFPIVVKPNVGGSGAGIKKFSSITEVRKAISNNDFDFGVDHTALVQEFVPARGGSITRLEMLGGKFLYAARIDTDVLNSAEIEAHTLPAEVIRNAEAIVQKAGIDVGGVDYLVDDRDGEICYCDVNALSNFLTDAASVIGFDPYEKLVDFLEHEAIKQTEDIAVV